MFRLQFERAEDKLICTFLLLVYITLELGAQIAIVICFWPLVHLVVLFMSKLCFANAVYGFFYFFLWVFVLLLWVVFHCSSDTFATCVAYFMSNICTSIIRSCYCGASTAFLTLICCLYSILYLDAILGIVRVVSFFRVVS